MGPRLRSLLVRGVVPAAIGVLAAAASAQSVHEIVPGGDTVTGSIDSGTDLDRIPFRLVESSKVTISVKAVRGSLLLPQVTVLGTDRQPDPLFNAVLLTSKKGNSVSAKKVVVDETGLRWIEIRGLNGTTGGWTLSFKVVLPKKGLGKITAAEAGPVDFPFVAPGNVTASLKVSAARGVLPPVFTSLRDPVGAIVPVDEILPGLKGFTAPFTYIGLAGRHTLRVEAAGPGGLVFLGKWKLVKPFKRTLVESQVITDPVASDLSPDNGDTSQAFTVTVVADFLEPGAKVVFRKPPTVVTIQGAAITLSPGQASFLLNVAPFQAGQYDVDVENPDGGKDSLPKAFTVINAVARPTSITPSSGFDNQVLTASIGGTLIHSQSTVSLQRDAETIPGTNQSGAGTLLQVDFDLRDRTQGLWDLVVVNPDAEPAVLDDVFEIVNSPPTLTLITPTNDLNGSPTTCSLIGTDIDAPPTALLRRAGQADVPGTSLVRNSSLQVTCSFDMTGKPLGPWDVVLTNPDGQSATLPGAFRVGGVVSAGTGALDFQGIAHAPVSVAWNQTGGEFLAAWVEQSGGSWQVLLQRLEADGTPIGNPVSVPTSADSVPKRDAWVAWDATHDECLVTWSEIGSLPSSLATSHPSYTYINSGVYDLYARAFNASTLSPIAAPKVITDNTLFQSWYMDEFHNFRSRAVWNPSAGNWFVTWVQEWNKSLDDYDVLARTYDPRSAATPLGGIVGIAFTPYHEGDLHPTWDPVRSRVLVVYNQRISQASVMDLRIGVASSGSIVVSDSSASLADPVITVDGESGRILLTWTRVPTSSGDKTLHGAALDGASITTVLGSSVPIGSSSGEQHYYGVSAWNTSLDQALIAWTKQDSGGGLSVRVRRATMSQASGLSLIGSEAEASGGTGDEGLAAAIATDAGADVSVFWAVGISLDASLAYTGAVIDGQYGCDETWLVRYD